MSIECYYFDKLFGIKGILKDIGLANSQINGEDNGKKAHRILARFLCVSFKSITTESVSGDQLTGSHQVSVRPRCVITTSTIDRGGPDTFYRSETLRVSESFRVTYLGPLPRSYCSSPLPSREEKRTGNPICRRRVESPQGTVQLYKQRLTHTTESNDVFAGQSDAKATEETLGRFIAMVAFAMQNLL